jgi:hypothetical protein
MARISTLDEGDAYGQGVVVRALGRSRECNPHSQDSREGVMWDEGWRLIDGRHNSGRSYSNWVVSKSLGSAQRPIARSQPNDCARPHVGSFFVLYGALLLALGGFLGLLLSGIMRLRQ